MGLYKSRDVREAEYVGLEREVSRRQFQEQQRLAVDLAPPPKKQLRRRRTPPGSGSIRMS